MTTPVIDTHETKRNRLANRKVFTFAPMQEGQQYLARVNGWPIDFRGETAMAAHKAAKAFIKSELEKLDNIEAGRLARVAKKAK